MTEYFIRANSFAAPFFSDDSTEYVEAETPTVALEKFAKNYKHPAGLYAAVLYASADDYHKGNKPLLKWLCNHEIEKMRLTKDLGSFTFLGKGPGKFEINNTLHVVPDPKSGQIIQPE